MKESAMPHFPSYSSIRASACLLLAAGLLPASPARGAQPASLAALLNCQTRLDEVKYRHWNWPA